MVSDGHICKGDDDELNPSREDSLKFCPVKAKVSPAVCLYTIESLVAFSFFFDFMEWMQK